MIIEGEDGLPKVAGVFFVGDLPDEDFEDKEG